MVEQKFKVGDIVRRLNGANRDWNSGELGKIVAVKNMWIDVLPEGKTIISDGNLDTNIELVQPQFKVGDWVVTNRFASGGDNPSLANGMIKYIGVKGQITRVYLDCDLRCEVHDWYWPASALTLVEEEYKLGTFSYKSIDYPVNIDYSKLLQITTGWIPSTKKTIMQTLKDVSVKLRAALGDVKANQIVAGLRNADLSLTTLGHNVVVNAIADGEDAVKVLASEAERIIAEVKAAQKNS